MGRRTAPPEDALLAARLHASFRLDAASHAALIWEIKRHIDLLASHGLTLADVGMRYDAVETKMSGRERKWTYTAVCLGHREAPCARSSAMGVAGGQDAQRMVSSQARRHHDVRRLLAAGRNLWSPGAAHVFADPVVAAAIRHHGDPDGLLASMPMDVPFVSRTGFVLSSPPPPVFPEVGLPIHAELSPGRLDAGRVGLGERAHYVPLDHSGMTGAGILTVRGEEWPQQIRQSVIGKRMAEIVDLPGLPEDLVIGSCTARRGTTIMRIAGNHRTVPLA